MIEEMIEEVIDLFGGMTLKEIAKEVLPAAGCFILMAAVIFILIGIQPI